MKQKIENLIKLVRVPAGEFLMGSDRTWEDRYGRTYGYDNEKPQHLVHVAEFEIGQYPITEAQYDLFVKATSRKSQLRRGQEDHPVIKVSWHDALTFCQWLGQETNRNFRLPTEAEWEKAARGSDGRTYPWGNDWDSTKLNAENKFGDTTPVNFFPQGASPYGVMDMAGNVWEWCSSLYKPYPYDANDGREDLGAVGARVLRGGSWDNNKSGARCTYRNDRTGFFIFSAGLRVVVAPG